MIATFLLLHWRAVGALIIVLALAGYIEGLRLERDHAYTKLAQLRADTERLASEAKVRNAQEAARLALNAKEVLDDLQTRHDALRARYDRLRANPGSGGVPDLASAASSLGSCGPKSIEPNATARFLAELESGLAGVLEAGDREIAKFVQLWALDQKNAQRR